MPLDLTALQAQACVDSPLGPLTLAATGRGLAIVWFEGQQHRVPRLEVPERTDHPVLVQAMRELDRWWRQPRLGFQVALDPQGTPFQQAVWQALRRIAPGELSSYGAIARQVLPDRGARASRAVGAAVGRNPLSIIVPCHRVVGADGSLTGYAGGLERKRRLLAWERDGTAGGQPRMPGGAA